MERSCIAVPGDPWTTRGLVARLVLDVRVGVHQRLGDGIVGHTIFSQNGVVLAVGDQGVQSLRNGLGHAISLFGGYPDINIVVPRPVQTELAWVLGAHIA